MFNKKIKHIYGFTLTEIMMTIIIIGVLASLSLPRFNSTIERMRAAEGIQILTALLGAQKAYEIEHPGTYATNIALLDVEIDRADNFIIPPTVANPADPVNNPIATITRKGPAYTLGINENGVIGCTNGGGGVTCAEAGF